MEASTRLITSLSNLLLAASLAIAASGCSDSRSTPPVKLDSAPREIPAARGARLFALPVGGLSCADCHAVTGEDQPRADRRFVAHTLRDATRRGEWWYGTLKTIDGRTVNDAVRNCVARFQERTYDTVLPVLPDGSRDLARVEIPIDDLDALVAHLETLAEPGPHPPLLVRRDDSAAALRRVDALPGDATRGRAVFARACASCHGVDGVGDLGQPLRGSRSAPSRRQTIEYVRSGPNRSSRESKGAWMPWFTADILPDQDLADVATFLAEPE